MGFGSVGHSAASGFPTLPANVAQALAAPDRRAVLDRLATRPDGRDADLDRLTGLAASLADASASAIQLVDVDRQWTLSSVGLAAEDADLAFALCAGACAAADGSLFIEDLRQDPHLGDLARQSAIRSCAAAALVVDGAKVGALLVAADGPRPEMGRQLSRRLGDIAALAASLILLKDRSRRGDLAAAALTRVEKRHKLALEAATIASWVWHVKSGIVECDPLLPELFNLAPATRVRARRLFFAMDHRDLRETARNLDKSLDPNDDYFAEYRVRDTSPPRWLATRGRVIERDADGKPALVIGVSYDISHRRSTEESQRLLLRELNHRVKNTLATVQALASQTVRHAQEPRQFLEAFSARLQSLGRAHGLLSDHEWRGISLEELVRVEVRPFQDGQTSSIRMAGPAVWLTPDQAVALGLILHELASNALRHGALSVADGIVDVTWRISDQGGDAKSLTLVWRESGGPPVGEPLRRGFGSILIRRSLDKILASKVKHEFLPDGVRAEISLPLESQAS